MNRQFKSAGPSLADLIAGEKQPLAKLRAGDVKRRLLRVRLVDGQAVATPPARLLRLEDRQGAHVGRGQGQGRAHHV